MSAIGTFGAIQLAMSQLIGNMPEQAVLALKKDCDSLTTGNCAWYDYRAAQWVAPEIERRLKSIETQRARAEKLGGE